VVLAVYIELASSFRPIYIHQKHPVEQKHPSCTENNQPIMTSMARFTSLFLLGVGFLLQRAAARPNERRQDSNNDHIGTLGDYGFQTMDAPESLLKGTHDGLFSKDSMEKYMRESGMQIEFPFNYTRYTPDMLPDYKCASPTETPSPAPTKYFTDVQSQLTKDGVKDSWCCSLYNPCTRLATAATKDGTFAASDICALDTETWKPTCLPCRLLQLALFKLEVCAFNTSPQVVGGNTTYVKLLFRFEK
jgi:hypothetical protein